MSQMNACLPHPFMITPVVVFKDEAGKRFVYLPLLMMTQLEKRDRSPRFDRLDQHESLLLLPSFDSRE